MNRLLEVRVIAAVALAAALFSAACGAERTSAAAPPEPSPVAVRAAQVESESIGIALVVFRLSFLKINCASSFHACTLTQPWLNALFLLLNKYR